MVNYRLIIEYHQKGNNNTQVAIDKPNEEKKMVWEFPIEFQEAKSYRTEVNSLLRPTQWQDLLVRVYV